MSKRTSRRSAVSFRPISLNKDTAPIPIHVTEIENADYVGKLVQVNVMITAAVEAFQVPTTFELNCLYSESAKPMCSDCPCLEGTTVSLSATDPNILRFCRVDFAQSERIAKELFADRFGHDCPVSIRLARFTTVQELAVVPQAQIIKENSDGELIDQDGRDYRQKIVYLLGNLQKTDGGFRLTGIVYPHPRTQTPIVQLS